MYTSIKVWQEVREDGSEFSFTAAVRGFHVYHRVWLPHVGQCLSAEKEHGNAEDHFAIAITEHSDTRADEDADDRLVVGHLPRELSKVLVHFFIGSEG